MNIPVLLSEMKISQNATDTLIARNVGTGLGLAIHDPVSKVGGLYHIMLPSSEVYPGMAHKKPLMFADTGIPAFMKSLIEKGISKPHLRVSIAGGADLIPSGKTLFSVGRENIQKASEVLKKHGVFIQEHTVGGNQSRAFFMNIGSGKSWVNEK